MSVSYLAGEARVAALVEEFLTDFGITMDALFSVLGRMGMRALECKFIADSMDRWLDELMGGDAVYKYSAVPEYATGLGLTEAPRGALGHWIDISSGKISRYQVVTPTTWNASPRDDFGQLGPLEQALIGTPVADLEQPIEVLRVIRSFDPCIACAVHIVRAGSARFRVSV
jgi:hydrogenase large subunit